MQRSELESIRDELRRELGRRSAVAEGLPAEFGETGAEIQLLRDLVEEAQNVPASAEERLKLAQRLLEGVDRVSRLSERL
jgi:hypothetical protein